MFLNDVHKKEEIQTIAIQDLKKLGIKYRCKKGRHHVQETKNRKVFKKPLQTLPTETVTLPSGQQLIVPKIVHELCSYIIKKISTEGIFRKGGSKSRQNEIRLSLDAGCRLGDEHHEIDVASVLKTFFRELPEPLIPYSFHEIFLRSMLLAEKQAVAVHLCCLLLPTEHLNTVTYFMQFLHRVSEYQVFNKMDAYNLAVVIGPTLLPAEEKIPHNATHRLTKTCELFKLLIETAANIGVLSESIIERIAENSTINIADDAVSLKKKKKRRSGSLTRMLSGLKKIVTNKSDEVPVEMPTPDLLSTPCLTRSAKKRKVEMNGMSSKKRRDIIETLPHNTIFNTPFAPISTPVNTHPDAHRKTPVASSKQVNKTNETGKEKKLLWPNRSKSNKKKEDDTTSISSRLSIGSSSIQRRWSAVSSAAGFKKKKTRSSCGGHLTHQQNDPNVKTKPQKSSDILNKVNENIESDYVKISKSEYEEIKNRVSAIERRISVELENAPPLAEIESPSPECATIKDVEMAYKQTLTEAEPLSPTTDQLARRLSKELKIRRSSEHKVFRSPSARKIGSMRRRSREGQVRLSRTQSWCVTTLPPRASLRRGKPNTVLSGLPPPTNVADVNDPEENAYENVADVRITRSSSFNDTIKTVNVSLATTNSSTSSWKSAKGYFTSVDSSGQSIESCRASLAKLRSQNAGMVMQKAKLFDNLGDTIGEPTQKYKIGAPRLETRPQTRVKALRVEDRRIGRKSMSPRRRNCKSPGNRSQRLQTLRNIEERSILKEYNKCELSPKTPRTVPHIKRTLNTKSPRRICRTPLSKDTKQTPLKALKHNPMDLV